MTKTRAPATIENALSRIIGQIGAAACAHACSTWLGRSVSDSLIYKWVDPDARERLPADAIFVLDIAFQTGGGEGSPLYETIGLQIDAAYAQRFACSAELSRRAVEVIKEGSEAAAAIVVAARPGATDADRAAAAREAEEAIAALTRTLPSLTNGAGPDSGDGEANPRGGDAR